MRQFSACFACAKEGKSIQSRYRCPACHTTSCSLVCVRIHKKDKNCSGVRDRAAHVRKADYNENTMMSDYNLLEETARAADSAAREFNDQHTGLSRGRMNLLCREAASRGIDLRFMPRGMARHTRNTSHVRTVALHEEYATAPEKYPRHRDKVMYWHVDVYFNGIGGGQKLVKVDTCDEDYAVVEIIKNAAAILRHKRRRTKVPDPYFPIAKAELDDLAVFIRNEHVTQPPQIPVKGRKITDDCDLRKYIPIERFGPLRDAMVGRTIVEYPLFHVALKGSKEAKQLENAVCGIFEAPEKTESDHSESEDDDESDQEGQGNPPVASGSGDNPQSNTEQDSKGPSVDKKTEPSSKNKSENTTGGHDSGKEDSTPMHDSAQVSIHAEKEVPKNKQTDQPTSLSSLANRSSRESPSEGKRGREETRDVKSDSELEEGEVSSKRMRVNPDSSILGSLFDRDEELSESEASSYKRVRSSEVPSSNLALHVRSSTGGKGLKTTFGGSGFESSYTPLFRQVSEEEQDPVAEKLANDVGNESGVDSSNNGKLSSNTEQDDNSCGQSPSKSFAMTTGEVGPVTANGDETTREGLEDSDAENSSSPSQNVADAQIPSIMSLDHAMPAPENVEQTVDAEHDSSRLPETKHSENVKHTSAINNVEGEIGTRTDNGLNTTNGSSLVTSPF